MKMRKNRCLRRMSHHTKTLSRHQGTRCKASLITKGAEAGLPGRYRDLLIASWWVLPAAGIATTPRANAASHGFIASLFGCLTEGIKGGGRLIPYSLTGRCSIHQ